MYSRVNGKDITTLSQVRNKIQPLVGLIEVLEMGEDDWIERFIEDSKRVLRDLSKREDLFSKEIKIENNRSK